MKKEEIVYVEDIIFMNKQNIPWNDVEEYLLGLVGEKYIVKETHDVIYIGTDFPDEYAQSNYTRSLRGNLAKVKANVAQIVGKLVVVAQNRRWIENKKEKHKKDAEKGWYRYDVYFAVPIQDNHKNNVGINIYKATLVVRHAIDGKKYLYDIVNIKKEARTPPGSS